MPSGIIFVALRENAVLMTIERLLAENQPIDYQIIADRLNCSFATVQRAMSNLQKSKMVKRVGTPRGGYTYIIDRTK